MITVLRTPAQVYYPIPGHTRCRYLVDLLPDPLVTGHGPIGAAGVGEMVAVDLPGGRVVGTVTARMLPPG